LYNITTPITGYKGDIVFKRKNSPTIEELKYIEIDKEVERQRIASDERKSNAVANWPNEDEICKIDEAARARRLEEEKAFPTKKINITRPVIKNLIKNVKLAVEKEDELALTSLLMMKVNILNDNSPSSLNQESLDSNCFRSDDECAINTAKSFIIFRKETPSFRWGRNCGLSFLLINLFINYKGDLA